MGDAQSKEATGFVTKVTETEGSTVKRMIGKRNTDYAFEFPTTEQLDKEADSTDQTVAKKANRLKRFTKRFDDALNYSLKIGVSWTEPTTLRLTIPAENISGVVVTPLHEPRVDP